LWIASDDQPFTLVECYDFQLLMNLCNPRISLPSADTIKNDILKLFKINQEKIKKILQVSISNDNLIYLISNIKNQKKKEIFINYNNKIYFVLIKKHSEKIKFYNRWMDFTKCN